MRYRLIKFATAAALSLVAWTAIQAQYQFPSLSPGGEEARELPENVPTDLIAPQTVTRETAAEKLARIFNRELRDIEERRKDIITELDELPEIEIENFLPQAFGYHSDSTPERPKWIQIDLGEPVSPDAIALFPATVQVKGETIFGYGFPRAFRIDISNSENFSSWETVYEGRIEGERRYPFYREIGGYEGRYIRVTAISLWKRKGEQGVNNAFALSEIMVLKGERNLAFEQPRDSLDSNSLGDKWAHKYVNDGITAFGIPHGKEKSPTKGYRSRTRSSVRTSWVQVELKESMPIDEIRIILAEDSGGLPDPKVTFPYPINIQISENPDMRRSEPLGRFTPGEITRKGNNLIKKVDDAYGKYIRFTMSQSKSSPMNFSLAEVQIFSENRNVALDCNVVGSHPVANKDYDPKFLVDGFSSRRSLVSYQSWLANQEQRIQLEQERAAIDKVRLDLVDRTFNRGVIGSVTGILLGLGLALGILAQGRVKRRKELESLRQRIASDLHDDIGSNLSSIALLAELGKTETGEPELVVEEFTEIKLTADKTIESMRDIVWLIRPGEETWKQMMTRFRETASKLLRAHEYSFVETGQMHDDRLPLEFKRDFFLIYKEVLNNIVRHAEADNVFIEVETARGKLKLKIQDDGKGFDSLDNEFREGNGLRNLRMRAQAIGAKLKVKSTLDNGTLVQLTAPLP